MPSSLSTTWKKIGRITHPSTLSTCVCSRGPSKIGPGYSPSLSSEPALVLHTYRVRLITPPRHLNPGGYIELFDVLNPLTTDDDTLPKDSSIFTWNSLLLEASQKLGRPLDSLTKYRDQLAEAGFVGIVENRYKWPINTWPKDARHKHLGAWTLENFNQGLQAVSLMLFTNVLGWSKEEVELLLVDVRKDVKNRHIHAYWPV